MIKFVEMRNSPCIVRYTTTSNFVCAWEDRYDFIKHLIENRKENDGRKLTYVEIVPYDPDAEAPSDYHKQIPSETNQWAVVLVTWEKDP